MSNSNQISPGFFRAKVWRFLRTHSLTTSANSLKLSLIFSRLKGLFNVVEHRRLFRVNLAVSVNRLFLFLVVHGLKVSTVILVSASVIGCGEKNYDQCTPDPSTVGQHLYLDGEYRKSIKFYCTSGCEYISPVSGYIETRYGYAFKSPTEKRCNSSAYASGK